MELPPKKLVIASSNKGKINEFQKFFDSFSIEIVSQPDGIEVEESGNTFLENASLKATSIASSTNTLAIADDSGLSVTALSGRPGIYSSRYANTDLERINRLLNELEGEVNRQAYFTCALCIASPKKEALIEVEGVCRGNITLEMRGTQGFGYDPVFEVLDTGQTYAEMSISQKMNHGHRGKALKLLKPKLQEVLALRTKIK